MGRHLLPIERGCVMRATRRKTNDAFTTPADVPLTYVVVVDELTGERREYDLPCDADEALHTCIECERAWYFADRTTMFRDGAKMSLGVSLRKRENVILIRWFAHDGDDDRALTERETELADWEGGWS